MPTTKKHPEQRPDEIYMGNARPYEIGQSSWRTSRLGEIGLKVDGSPLDQYRAKQLKPWFIQRSEVEAAIETERLSNKPGSAETIRVYESMLADEGEV